MKIKIKVHANSTQEKIEKRDGFYEVWIKQKAIDGRANAMLIKVLKKYFGKEVKIKSGFSSRMKVIEIND
jgi:uncharacterized protein (TIGR00251 family)